jgi:23S rRNA pseudouridine1911/1915/1917 synthase
VEEELSGAALVRVTLETGRRNQIRVQFAGIRHALVGDHTYGTASPLIPRVALHAARLGFIHPRTSKPVRVESPLPADMRRLLRRLRAAARKG